ncbi:MAG: hypothetical protein AAB617_03160 [Patescibacteria group bacterium]
MVSNFIKPFIIYAPTVFFPASLVLAVIFYFQRKNKAIKNLTITVIGFRIFYALVKSVGQYYVWINDELGKSFLATPGYFSGYIFQRFWFNVILTAGASFVFLIFLESLKKHKERFFEEGEIELGFLTALIVGWPNLLIFVPLVFISVVITSVFRRIYSKEIYTTLGKPFLLSALVTLLFGGKLVDLLNLGVFQIKI